MPARRVCSQAKFVRYGAKKISVIIGGRPGLSTAKENPERFSHSLGSNKTEHRPQWGVVFRLPCRQFKLLAVFYDLMRKGLRPTAYSNTIYLTGRLVNKQDPSHIAALD